jgi:hypothetical protein
MADDQPISYRGPGGRSGVTLGSEGEKRIARFLDDVLIKYRYEDGVLIYDSKDKPRI